MSEQAMILISRRIPPGEVSRITGIAEQTLAKWRMDRIGPPFERISGRCIRYPVDKLEQWLASRAVSPVENN